jgi:hypothetical protein
MTLRRQSLLVALAPLALLLLPLIATPLSDGVNWSGSDFLVMGTLLLTVGVVCAVILRFSGRGLPRVMGIGLVVLLFLLLWAELAVGIFGTPLAGS